MAKLPGAKIPDKPGTVVCIDNFVTGTVENVARFTRNPLFESRTQDATAPLDVAGPVDLVLHFASPASPPDYLRLPVETLLVGSQGTLRARSPSPGTGPHTRRHSRGHSRAGAQSARGGSLTAPAFNRPHRTVERYAESCNCSCTLIANRDHSRAQALAKSART